MTKKIQVGTQTDPQYGFVTADQPKSTGFNSIQAAKNLYKQLYGQELKGIYKDLKTPTKNAVNMNWGGETTSKDYEAYNKLMGWYYAASNPQYQNDPTYKAVLDQQSRAFTNRPSGGWGQSLGTEGVFGYYDPKGQPNLKSQFGKDYNKALAAVQLNSMMPMDKIPSAGQVSGWGMATAPRGPQKELYDYLRVQGGIPSGEVIQNGRKLRWEGPAYLSTLDPNLYGAATLKQYYEGLNPNIRSVNYGPWQAQNYDGSNQSWLGGGEFLTDEAFRFYKNKAQQGTIGSDWAATAGNPNLMTGSFNGQRSFFTPYEYAIKGIPDPTAKVTNIANVDPNFWAQQGNLQNINNQWGFVTQSDPFAGIANPNKQLQPETTTATLMLTPQGGGGFFGNLINALPSIGLSMIPGIGQFANIASGVQGIGAASNFFKSPDKPKLSGWYQPSVYPNWIVNNG